MKNTPYTNRRRLNALYRKLISIWVNESELTQDVYDDFLVQQDSEGTDDSGQPIFILNSGVRVTTQKQLDQFRQAVSRPLDLAEANNNPLWVRYVMNTIALPRINDNDGVLPDPTPLPPRPRPLPTPIGPIKVLG